MTIKPTERREFPGGPIWRDDLKAIVEIAQDCRMPGLKFLIDGREVASTIDVDQVCERVFDEIHGGRVSEFLMRGDSGRLEVLFRGSERRILIRDTTDEDEEFYRRVRARILLRDRESIVGHLSEMWRRRILITLSLLAYLMLLRSVWTLSAFLARGGSPWIPRSQLLWPVLGVFFSLALMALAARPVSAIKRMASRRSVMFALSRRDRPTFSRRHGLGIMVSIVTTVVGASVSMWKM